MPLRGSLRGSLLLPGNCCCACGNAAARAAQRSVPLSCCREFISADLACFPGSGFTSSVISKRRNSPFQSQAAEEPLDPLAGGGTSHIPSVPCWRAPPGPEGRGWDLQDRGCRPLAVGSGQDGVLGAAVPHVLHGCSRSEAEEDAVELTEPSPASSPLGPPPQMCRGDRSPSAAPTAPTPPSPSRPVRAHPPLPSSSCWTPPAVSKTQTISISCSNISNK